MHITSYLDKTQIALNARAKNRNDLLKKLTSLLTSGKFGRRNPRFSEKDIYEAVILREKERSTYIGEGFAFPHARIPGLAAPGAALVRLAEPLVYDEDNNVEFAFLVVTPLEMPTLSLKIMTGLIRFLSDPERRRTFMNVQNTESLLRDFNTAELKIDETVTALDIMRDPGTFVMMDTPLSEITRKMYTARLDAVPVLNKDKYIIGEVTSNRLFRFGLPDFFTKLKSVSFIAEFDPFEQYFSQEADAVANDLEIEQVTIISAEATILEIVFELAVQKRPQLYVINSSDEWVGVIDRSCVLNNVINF